MLAHWLDDDPSATYGLEADVYSFGIILWELTTRRMPWEDVQASRYLQIKNKVLAGERPSIPDDVTQSTAAGGVGSYGGMHQPWLRGRGRGGAGGGNAGAAMQNMGAGPGDMVPLMRWCWAQRAATLAQACRAEWRSCGTRATS